MISNSKLIVRGLALAVAAFVLSACGTMSPFSGYVTAPPEAKKEVESGKYVEEVAAQIVIYQNPDFNGGRISPKALRKIQLYSISCQQQIDAQLAGRGQSAGSGALNYGIAGTGTGPAAVAAFSGVKMIEYSTYGSIAYLLPGAVNGMVSGAYAMASAKGTCTRDFWEDIAKTDPDFRGTHVSVAYSGKRSDSRPPALSPVTAPSPKSPLAR